MSSSQSICDAQSFVSGYGFRARVFASTFAVSPRIHRMFNSFASIIERIYYLAAMAFI